MIDRYMIGLASHPGQLCNTSWMKTSQSIQKSWLHSEHRYRELVSSPPVFLFLNVGNSF